MTPDPKGPPGPGQRSLAAIVFTDVVGFSARMQADEEATLRLLQRDFDAMREICVQHQGSVLKTTGDGLLLYFSSAVQAVACALAMQRLFAGQAKSRLPAENLTHRLGIHLGDVFVNDQDVMGDGVNIAARLQAEAVPGGICISQTVYDVVKSKLALHVTRLSPRELKNISQHIPIYRLLLEASTLETPVDEPPVPAARESHRVLITGGVGLALLLALLAGLLVRTNLGSKADRARAAAAQEARQAVLAADAADPRSPGKNARLIAAWHEELHDQRSRAAEEYNFAEMARSLNDPRSPVAGKPEAQDRAIMLRRMQLLFAWLASDLQRYNRENPLVVRELSGTAPKEIKVYVGLDRRLYYAEGGAIRQRNLVELRPRVLAAIFAGALLGSPDIPPGEVVLGALAFGYFYGTPELAAALRRGPGG